MCDLPEDIVIEVLVRVEAEMAPRLRCVSKSWQTLIDSPEFRHKRCGDITQLIYLSWGNRLYMTRCNDGPEKMIPDIKIDMERKMKGNIDLIGSCNGVLCLLLDESKVVVLVNPCTKQYVELPQVLPKRGYLKSIGFGYDNVNDDYKVVRLAQDDCNLSEFKVYSLRLKCWRDLEHPYGNKIAISSDRGIFVKCALHWIIFDGNIHKFSILASNLTTGKLRLFPLPAEASAALFRDEYGFGDIDDCLSLLILDEYCHVWMMKEYGLQYSWMKLSLQTPNLISDRKNFLLVNNWRKNLLRCNFDARSVLKPPQIPTSNDYLVFQDNENDLILWNPKRWKTVFTFAPSLVKLPAQN